MSELTHKKMALAFGLFSFGLMVFGSIFSGATFVTALIRGTEAAILFALIVFILGFALVEKEEDYLADLKNLDKKDNQGQTA